MKKVILLENIRSLQNVWAVFRNADGAWFDKVLLTWYTPTPPRAMISKTALWAEGFLDWEYYSDISYIIDDLKKEWFLIISVELTSDAVDFKELSDISCDKVCLIMWNEVDGVSKKVLEISDKCVIIPMRWKKESLNVSVAAWIVMYQL